MTERPSIPSELKRKIFVEAGHRCAIPTCRYIEVDVHHIIPWETCKEHKYENLIALCPNCHKRADLGKIDRKSLKLYKYNLRYLYDKFTLFEIDILFELNKIASNEALPLLPSFILLIKRLLDSGYVKLTETPAQVKIAGLKANPDLLQITPAGKEFISQLSIDEL